MKKGLSLLFGIGMPLVIFFSVIIFVHFNYKPSETTTAQNNTTTTQTTSTTSSYSHVDEYADVYSGIDANCWYEFKEFPYLKTYNAVIKYCNPNSYNKSCYVSYYPVCCMCHLTSSYASYDIVKTDKSIEKTYRCTKCSSTTYVVLKIYEYL